MGGGPDYRLGKWLAVKESNLEQFAVQNKRESQLWLSFPENHSLGPVLTSVTAATTQIKILSLSFLYNS